MSDNLAAAEAAAGSKATLSGVVTAGRYEQKLSRSLSFRENVLITMSSVTPASSVFIIVPSVINGIGGASAVAFAIASVVGVAIALCYAELSAAFPITGGEYAFVARTLGKPLGFALFVLNLVSGVFILGVIASGTATYLGTVWGALSGEWVGIVVILVTTAIGCLGIRTNAWVTGIFLALELAALVVLITLGFTHVTQPISTLWTPQTIAHHGVLTSAGAGLVISYTATALFAMNGYGTAVYFAEETKQATKTIARAILWSLAIAVAAEFLPLIAVLLGTPSVADLVGSDDPMSYFLLARGGRVVHDIVSVAIAVAIVNAVLAIMLQNGRLLYSSARDLSWPTIVNRPLAQVSSKFKTPVTSTVVIGLLGALLLWLVPFTVLLTATGAGLLILYALVGLAAFVGRLRQRTGMTSYRMKGWPLVPLIMVAATGVVGYETWDADWVPVVVAVAIFAVGLPYFYLYLHPRRGERWTLPDAVDEEVT